MSNDRCSGSLPFSLPLWDDSLMVSDIEEYFKIFIHKNLWSN